MSSTLQVVNVDDLRRELEQIGRRRTEAIRVRDETGAQLGELVPAAHAAGLGATEIARLTGVSRQGVYDLLPDGARGSKG